MFLNLSGYARCGKAKRPGIANHTRERKCEEKSLEYYRNTSALQ